jgi:SAM-dependent methyltransferase
MNRISIVPLLPMSFINSSSSGGRMHRINSLLSITSPTEILYSLPFKYFINYSINDKIMTEKCCTPNMSQRQESIRNTIRKHYGELALQKENTCCTPMESTCCGTTSCTITPDYSPAELENLPKNAVAASAGCGNPAALAELKPGETVLDLGCGGGIDVFLAANKVGPSGKVIGVDMTPDMIELARKNSIESGYENVDFRLGEIEHLPVADNSVDVILSNCVINLSLDKEAVFREAYRVLRNGGRLVVSDIMAEGLPNKARDSLSMWASCIGGALPLNEYISAIEKAGLVDIKVLANTTYPKEFLENTMKSSEIEYDQNMSLSHAEIQAHKN